MVAGAAGLCPALASLVELVGGRGWQILPETGRYVGEEKGPGAWRLTLHSGVIGRSYFHLPSCT